MLLADAYLDRIDFLKYLPRTDCAFCGLKTCKEFVDGLKDGRKTPADCPGIPKRFHYPMQIALEADDILPQFPCVTTPHPGPIGAVEINSPLSGSPLLVSGNNVHTQDVLTSLLSTTQSPFFLLFADTGGNTVDMAIVYETLTADRVVENIRSSGVLDAYLHGEIIIPGLASGMGKNLTRLTGGNVVVGPICAAELPLFLADRWLPVGS